MVVVLSKVKENDLAVDGIDLIRDNSRDALCNAVENLDEDKVIKLLKLGYTCHPNRRNKVTCLHIASQRGYLKITQHLLDHGFNIHEKTKEYKTPLHEAVDRGQVEVARLLLQRGASTECKDTRSDTPLFVACQNGDRQVVKTLLEFNANVHAKDAYGRSPLHAARESNIIKMLAKKGLNIDITGSHGDTPLHCAARDYDKMLIKTLLDLGANPTIKNKDGNIPRDLAEPQTWQPDKTAIHLLREAEQTFNLQHVSGADRQRNKSVHNEDKRPSTAVTKMDEQLNEREVKIRTQTTANNSDKKKPPMRTDKRIRAEIKHQTANYKKDMSKKDRCLGEVSDREIGRIALTLDQKQAKKLRKMVPKQMKHRISENEKGNCRNEYFHLLKTACFRNREMAFDAFKKRISLTKPDLHQMSREEKKSMEKDIEKLQLSKIKIENLRLITVLSMVASKDYYLLGIELGLSSEAMDEIHDLQGDLLRERCHQTLRKTKERFPKKTCADVVRAVANIGHDYVKAMELLRQSEHFSPIRYS
ncbi:uncharacterized protein [Argopecten irradians]|uniref:uncharacterized protein isoform X2 n=1 Tax=Argopecten irradians TaxID=31199 RepID=UPI00371D8794